MDELDYWLRLTRVPNLHADALHSLLATFGSLAALFDASAEALTAAGFTAIAIDRLQNYQPSQLSDDREWLSSSDHHFVSCDSADYPVLLTQLKDAPIGLFVRGNVAILQKPQLAIVGARNPTSSGRETAEAFAAHLVGCDLAITSGLAAGIDAAAHGGALRAGGETIAVCATGLDTVYPSDHRELAEAICANGALVSEFPCQTKPLKYHFPRRNRLISGLSLGTLVVEAAIHSGSLITAKIAADQGREVFAIPGSIHNPLARGCHQLLRQGAKLVESATDVLNELGPLNATLRAVKAPNRAQSGGALLDKDYKMLLDAIGFDNVSIDQLVERTRLGADAVASMLLILELDGHVTTSNGGLYGAASNRV